MSVRLIEVSYRESLGTPGIGFCTTASDQLPVHLRISGLFRIKKISTEVSQKMLDFFVKIWDIVSSASSNLEFFAFFEN